MDTHLVLVVHGIGEQTPGETVDQVVAAAISDHDDRPDDDLRNVPLDISATDLLLTEERFTDLAREPLSKDAKTAAAPIARTFPCKTYSVTSKGEDPRKTVFSEVYWSDLSPAPKGALGTILDLLRLILGLGYLAMDNVENTRGNFHRGIVHVFNWVFYGAIAVLNTVLLVGAGVLVLEAFLPEFIKYWAYPLIHLGVVGILAYFLHRYGLRKPTFLVTVFRRGLYLWLGLAAAIFLSLVFARDVLLWLLDPLERHLDKVASDHSVGCKGFLDSLEGVHGLPCFVELNIYALNLSWIAASLLCLISLSGYFGGVRQVIYPAICSAMLVFWSVMTSGFWMVLRQLADQFDKANDECKPSALRAHATDFHDQPLEAKGSVVYQLFCDYLGAALGTLTIAVLFFVALTLVAVFIFRRSDRVILNGGLQAILSVFPIVLIWIIILSNDPNHQQGTQEALGAFASMAGAIALGLALVVYNFYDKIAAGLGVARDIITYAVRKECLWTVDAKARQANYPERARIENRFKRVFSHMVAMERPDFVTIISHSQGTVVAARALGDIIPLIRAGDPGAGENLRLITMGSPISHIYREYFPQNYNITKDAISTEMQWFNIYRSKDFVGQKVYTAGLPDDADILAGVGGHSHYFTDKLVWRRLWKNAGFRLFPKTGDAT